MAKYSIGLDYGTLSARAILVDIDTGETIVQSIYPYPHAVMENHIPDGTQLPAGWALQDPQDYLEAMVDTIRMWSCRVLTPPVSMSRWMR